ncbi:hypothetical protein C1N73_31555 (plasmid) [Priestia aryabhattai]
MSEWGMSLFILIIYIIYVGARQITMRITKDDLLEEGEKKKTEQRKLLLYLYYALRDMEKGYPKRKLHSFRLTKLDREYWCFYGYFHRYVRDDVFIRNKKQSEI